MVLFLLLSQEAGDSGSDSSWSPMSSDSTTSSSEEEGERGVFHYTAEYFLKKYSILYDSTTCRMGLL